MVTEHDSEFEPWPGEVDSINTTLMPLIEHIFELTADGSPERKAAMNEVLALPARIRAALRPKPRLN
jgi:hypothetical protein